MAVTYVEVDIGKIGEIVNRYNEVGTTLWSRYHETTHGQLRMRHWDNHPEWRFLDSQIERHSLILDYGCGSGNADVFLAILGHTVVGYDSSPTATDVARYIASIQSPEVSQRLSFYSKAIPRREYDVIWICHVLEHIPKSEWASVFGLLKEYAPHPKLVVSSPLGKAYYVPDHVNFWYTDKELADDLSQFVAIDDSLTNYTEHVVRVIGRF